MELTKFSCDALIPNVGPKSTIPTQNPSKLKNSLKSLANILEIVSPTFSHYKRQITTMKGDKMAKTYQNLKNTASIVTLSATKTHIHYRM